MTIDDLPNEMVGKYLNRYRNATKAEKEKVESCLSALTCVLTEKVDINSIKPKTPPCHNIEKICITSNTNFPTSDDIIGDMDDDNAGVISSNRLAITYLSGGEWSPSQRSHLLECKIENLLCQLPHDEEGSGNGFDEIDPFYIDIKRDVSSSENILEETSGQRCVTGMYITTLNVWLYRIECTTF